MRTRAVGGESGQATIEWVGLVLGLALALGGAALAAGAADFGGEADELGEALARRVTGGAGDAGGGGRADRGRGGALRSGGLRPGAGPLRTRRRRERPPRAPRTGSGTLGDTGRVALRGLDKAGRFAGGACLGYRRFEYDLEHPRTPRQGIPVGDTLDMLNGCLNPLGFLFP